MPAMDEFPERLCIAVKVRLILYSSPALNLA
jgi:hypothetical protein